MKALTIGRSEPLAAAQSPSGAAPAPIVIDRRWIVRSLAAAAVAIVLLGYFREFYIAHWGLETPLRNLRHFHLDSEGTLPAWFSSFVLLLAAGLLAAIAGLSRRENDADWRRWSLPAILFLFMSIDEASAVHEVLIKPLRSAFGLGGIFFFSWVIPALFVIAGLGLYLVPFVLRLPYRHALRFALCGAIFVGGAVGMEMVSDYYASRDGMEARSYIVAACAEETLEIIGATLFCAALFAYLRERWGTWTLRVT
jgi:hypothetical protein